MSLRAPQPWHPHWGAEGSQSSEGMFAGALAQLLQLPMQLLCLPGKGSGQHCSSRNRALRPLKPDGSRGSAVRKAVWAGAGCQVERAVVGLLALRVDAGCVGPQARLSGSCSRAEGFGRPAEAQSSDNRCQAAEQLCSPTDPSLTCSSLPSGGRDVVQPIDYTQPSQFQGSQRAAQALQAQASKQPCQMPLNKSPPEASGRGCQADAMPADEDAELLCSYASSPRCLTIDFSATKRVWELHARGQRSAQVQLKC